MPHAKRSSAGSMHGGRPRNSLRSNSLGLLSAVCIKPALNRMAHMALATCPIHACHSHCHVRFVIKERLESMPFRVNHIQLDLLHREQRYAKGTGVMGHGCLWR